MRVRITGSWFRGALAAAILSALPPAASAQTAQPPSELSELTIEQLVDLKIDSVYGASRYTQKVTEAPSSITIVTADEIYRHGYTSLAAILRSVRGFYVTYDRNYSFIGVRGFSRPGDYNTRILLLIDGHRLNDSVFGGALLGTEFPLDVELIDRVEIIRGPSSSLYGTSAFFAVINIITRRTNGGQTAEASASLGSLDTRKGRFTYGETLKNGTGLFLSATAYTSAGQKRLFFEEFNSPATNHGIAENADADEFAKLFARVTRGNLTLQALYGARDKTIPTASFGTVFNDNRSRTVEKQGFLDLQYDRRLPAAWDLTTRVYYDRYGYDGDYVFDQPAGAAARRVVNKDFARGNWWGAEAKVARRLAEIHRVNVGAEYRDNTRQDQSNFDQDPFFLHLDDRRNSTLWALYAQDEISIHRRLLLNVGLRHDHYSTFGGTTNPRLGLIYDPRPNTTLKLLYGQAFRAPNAYELFWHQSGVTKSNPALQPETNRTSELVVEQYLGNHVRAAATAFYYKIHDLISQETDPADGLLVYNNIDQIDTRGIELEAEGRWPTGLQSRLSYTLQNGRDAHTRMRLTNSPRHLVQFNLLLPVLRERMLGGLEFQYIGRRRTIAGAELGGTLVPNLTLVSRSLRPGLDLSASVYNLIDRNYADPGSEEHRQNTIAQNGRTFGVKLIYRFQGSN